MALIQRDTWSVTSGSTTDTQSIGSLHWGGAGGQPHCFVLCAWYSDVNREIISVDVDDVASGDVDGVIRGTRALRVVDTNLGVVAEIWYGSNWQMANTVGWKDFTVTFDANVAFSVNNNYFHMTAWEIDDTQDLGLLNSDSVVEQASGLVGAALAGGTTANTSVGAQILLSNETSAANLTQEAAYSTPLVETLHTTTGTYMGLYYSSTGTTTTDWGATAMTVGGGSGIAANFELGATGGAGGGAARPKAAPMQFPMGLGNWTMSNGILTR